MCVCIIVYNSIILVFTQFTSIDSQYHIQQPTFNFIFMQTLQFLNLFILLCSLRNKVSFLQLHISQSALLDGKTGLSGYHKHSYIFSTNALNNHGGNKQLCLPPCSTLNHILSISSFYAYFTHIVYCSSYIQQTGQRICTKYSIISTWWYVFPKLMHTGSFCCCCCFER